jgi:hypothetical protein
VTLARASGAVALAASRCRFQQFVDEPEKLGWIEQLGSEGNGSARAADPVPARVAITFGVNRTTVCPPMAETVPWRIRRVLVCRRSSATGECANRRSPIRRSRITFTLGAPANDDRRRS